MADNVAITAGAGTTISTEEVTTLNGGGVSAQHVQRIAAAIRTADGTAIDLPGDSSNGMDVDVTRLPAVNGVAASTMNASSSDGATALTNSAQAIKGSAGRLCGYFIYNPNTATVYVQFYNVASGSVTVGTTNPLFMLPIPPGSSANLWMQPGGVEFTTAMSWAATSTAGGNAAPTTALDATAWYA